jgi:putative endopeptidase
LKKQPNIGWNDFLNHLGAKTDSIDVGQPAYYEKLNTLLKTIPMANWKLYLKANAIEGYATDLSKPLLMPLSIYQNTSGQAAKNHVEKLWLVPLITI